MTRAVDPSALDKVLALRPSNAVGRLGAQSRLPLLNPRDLLAALEGQAASLLCIPSYTRAAMPGALKASRDQDAVMGIGCPYPLGERDSPQKFVEALAAAADEVRHRKPFFLQAGPFRIPSADARTTEKLSQAVYKYVDAGFTAIALDASSLSVDEAVHCYRELSQAPQERELALEVSAPVDAAAQVDPDRARELLRALSEEGVVVNFLRVPGAAYALEPNPAEHWQLDLSVLKALSQVASEFKVALSVEDEGAAPDALANAWLDAGVRKVEPAHACAQIATRAWTKARVEEWGGARDALAVNDAKAPADEHQQLRAEAATWALSVDLLPRVGLAGSATRAVEFLSRGGRY